MGKRRLTRPAAAKEKQRKRSHWIVWAVLGALVLVVGGIAAYLMAPGPTQTARKGQAAPDFTLRLLNGQNIALSSLKGQSVLVNFWHSS